MKSLVLAEKPSVGKEIGRVLNCTNRQKSFWEGNGYIVTWAMGHLIELAEPSAYDERYKKWSLDYLPMLPKPMKHKIIGRTSGQFRTIKGLLKRKDVGQVIIATDAGREGELVARWIMRLGGWKGEYKRLWISSQTDAAIKQGFAGLKPGQSYDNLFRAAECRAEADWIVGLNISRALSCKFDSRLSAGRVQTPTLAMIVRREGEIEGFVPEPFWTVHADLGSFDGRWQSKKGSDRIRDERFAEEVVAKVAGKRGTITSVERKKKNEPPPLAYDLTALQRDANVQLGFSARKTLQVLQGLYERHKYVTYPRTDSRHITEDIVDTLPDRLKALQETPFGGTAKPLLARRPVPGKRFVDGSKVSDHHAIIPTEERVDIKRLDTDEKSLWSMIVRRFLAVLSPPYRYESTRVIVEVENERFVANGTYVIDPGWRRIESHREDGGADDAASTLQNLSSCKEGDSVIVEKASKKQGFTKPPARYTEATLLGAMESPGRFIEDKDLKASIARGGLGTPATRAEIIEKLISSYYIERNGKELRPTVRGTELLALVPEPLKSPLLTAEWEQRLVRIEKGHEKAHTFSKDIRDNAVGLINHIKKSTAEYKPKNTTGQSCPMCGKPLMAVTSKRGVTLMCHALSCGYEEEKNRGNSAGGRPTKRERDTARRYMGKYGDRGGETSSFGDLIKAAQERKTEVSLESGELLMAGFWDTLGKPFSALAPMEDVTDTVFRQLLATWGAPDVFFTEFVNVDGMCSPGREAVIHRLLHSDTERPLVAQVWGLHPQNFEKAARDIADMNFDGIDINMGCPVKKIVKTGACSALIENPTLASEMIVATQEGAGDLPVSVKTRIGFRKRKTLEWSRFLLEHNLSALTVHGRISSEMSDVPADWEEIRKVVEVRDAVAPAALVIGNGDVKQQEQLDEFPIRYGVDGVMVGRGIFHNPFLFRSGSFEDLNIERKASLLKEHITLYRKVWGEERNFNVMKKFVKVYIRGFNGAAHLRAELMEAESYEELLACLQI